MGLRKLGEILLFFHVWGFHSTAALKNVAINCNQTTECCTQECIEAATTLKDSLDLTTDPCDDFYQFACGNYISSTQLYDYEQERNRYTTTKNRTINLLRGIVDSPVEQTDHPALKLTKELYFSCTDEESINNKSEIQLKALLDQVGGWPVISPSWNSTIFSLVAIKLLKIGFKEGALFSVEIVALGDNNYEFMLRAPRFHLPLGSPLQFPRNHTVMEEYYKYMTEVAIALGGNTSTVFNEMEEVLNFESQLNEVFFYSETNEARPYGNEHRNASHRQKDEGKQMTLRELQIRYPGFPWIEYFGALVYPFHNITLNETVSVYRSHILQNLTELFNKTSNRIMCDYVIWRGIDFVMPALNATLRGFSADFRKAVSGVTDTVPRGEYCMKLVERDFSVETAYFFVSKYFNGSIKESATHLVERIRDQFMESLYNITWMDNNTKNFALEKARKIKLEIGFPEIMNNITFVDDFYSGLNITNASFLLNSLQLQLFQRNKTLMYIFSRTKSIDQEFLKHVTEVSAHYEYSKNAMIVHAAILQDIFYGGNRTAYLNYGGIGGITATEMSHAFDVHGRHYNEWGKRYDWWDNVTIQEYNRKKQCFIKQYGNISVSVFGRKLQVDGSATLAKNIADNTGLKETYLAYLRYIKRNRAEKTLPGLPYNPKQLLWLQYSSVNCEKMRNQTFLRHFWRDRYVPVKYRVNIAVGNLEYFHQDWNCSSKSKMNFNETCSLW